MPQPVSPSDENFDHKQLLASLGPAVRQSLTAKSDRAGLQHLALHLGLVALIATLIAIKVPFWWLLLLPQGVLLVFLFTLQHEATHRTPFASQRLNECAGHLCALLIVQPFYWFRYFHLAHHRFTNDPQKDPELAGGGKPESWLQLLWHISCVGYWRDKLAVLFTNAFRDPSADYLPRNRLAQVRREARLLIVLYLCIGWIVLAVSDVLLWVWLIPLLLGFPFLRIYLLAEHAGCAFVPNMLANTRTTLTNRLVCFIAWNMPYHIEHHVFPTVPFHRLPHFHKRIREYSYHVENGYLAFARQYVEDISQAR